MKSQKVTKEGLTSRRSYDDACGAAHALDLVGERWALLVMRELMLGPKRFSDLRADLPGISANVLTQRLEGLEAAGIVARRRLPHPIEQAFSKLKSYLRAACARSQDTLMEGIGKALSTITVSDAEGYFEHCGYRRVVQSL